MSGFVNWLFNPGTKGKDFSLNEEISDVLLNDSVTVLKSQQERTQRVFELVSRNIDREDLIESCLCGHDICTLFITYIYRLFKSYVLYTKIEERIDIEKCKQITHLFETRRKDSLWCNGSSLESRVKILKAADPRNKHFTDDELRLFSFDQAFDLTCSKTLSIKRDTAFVSFIFDKDSNAQYSIYLEQTHNFLFRNAMRLLKKQALFWESQKFGRWKLSLEKMEDKALIRLQIDEIRKMCKLEEIPTEKLFDFVAGLDKQKSQERLRTLQDLCRKYKTNITVYSLKNALRALESSRSMSLRKLRALSRVDEISPKILERFEAALNKDPNRHRILNNNEINLLGTTRAIYYATKTRPEIFEALSHADRNTFYRLHFAWASFFHEQIKPRVKFNEIRTRFSNAAEEQHIADISNQVLLEFLDELQRDLSIQVDDNGKFDQLEEFYSDLVVGLGKKQLEQLGVFLQEEYPIHALLVSAYLERNARITEATARQEAQETQGTLRALRLEAQAMNQEDLSDLIRSMGTIPAGSTIEELVNKDKVAALKNVQHIYETITNTRTLHPFLDDPQNQQLKAIFEAYNTYLIRKALSEMNLEIPQEVPNYADEQELRTFQADDGTEVFIPARFIRNTSALNYDEVTAETPLSGAQFIFEKNNADPVEVSTLKDLVNMLAAVKKFDFVQQLDKEAQDAFLLKLLLSFDPRHSPTITQLSVELARSKFQLIHPERVVVRFTEQAKALQLEADFNECAAGLLSGHVPLGATVATNQVLCQEITAC